jgi:hypothetical protein
LVDISSGDSKPITPEGIVGTRLSPDDKYIAVLGPDRKRGIWPLEGGGFRAIPGLEAKDAIIGWTSDGKSVYVAPVKRDAKSVQVFRADIQTGKMEPWRTFGDAAGAEGAQVVAPHLSSDGNGYAYLYVRTLSEAYVVNGLR